MKTLKHIFFIAIISLLSSCNGAINPNPDDTEEPDTEEIQNDLENDPAYKSYIQDILDCMRMPRPKDSYNYPVYPGMAEWANFKTGAEMHEACQVPDDILKTMSTQAVLQAIWEYPLLSGVIHRYQYQLDFNSFASTNNAYNELISRTDAGMDLLERLLVLDPVHSALKDVTHRKPSKY